VSVQASRNQGRLVLLVEGKRDMWCIRSWLLFPHPFKFITHNHSVTSHLTFNNLNVWYSTTKYVGVVGTLNLHSGNTQVEAWPAFWLYWPGSSCFLCLSRWMLGNSTLEMPLSPLSKSFYACHLWLYSSCYMLDFHSWISIVKEPKNSQQRKCCNEQLQQRGCNFNGCTFLYNCQWASLLIMCLSC